MARENSVSYIIAAKKINFSLWWHRKENWRTTKLFMRRVLKGFLFYVKKNKGKIFFDGKSRGTLLAGATLNNRVYLSQAIFFFYKCALKSPGKFGQNTTELAIWNLKKKVCGLFLCALHFYWVSQIFSFLLMLPIITETYKEGSSIEKDGNNCLRKKLTKLSILVHII